MYKDIIQSIQTILESVSSVKEIYAYPIPGSPKKYPAVIFTVDSFSNSFETQAENMKICRFKLWVTVDLAGTDEKKVFTSILPKVVDDVVKAFDTGWSGQISGHRAWKIIDSGDWGLVENEKGKRAYAELTLTVKMVTDL